MPTPDKQLSAEQSRQISDTIREEIARRRISRQSLAELAKLSPAGWRPLRPAAPDPALLP